MATKKSNTPEKNVNTGSLVTLAKDALNHRAQAAEHSTQEKALTEVMGRSAEDLRQQDVANGEYYGLIRITAEDQQPVRVEFRIENGGLSVSEEAKLDALYGGSRPVLFRREKVVTDILNPLALVQELITAGKNPFDYLVLSVRDGMDHALVQSSAVSSAEAFLPTKDFIGTIEGIKGSLSEEAKIFTNNYLVGALKPRVVLGSKGKA